jgi:hypothetical protein
MTKLLLLVVLTSLLSAGAALSQNNIMRPGVPFHGIRDYRQVMPGVMYRGGANNGRDPLNQNELDALCEEGLGTAYYLYSTGFHGPSVIHCSKGDLSYRYQGWQGRGRTAIHQAIYDIIKSKGKPVFVHCWNGIHATGAVAATALMQFCGISSTQAVDYWKVGIAPKVQYQSVIHDIQSFRSDPNLELTPEERAAYCPDLAATVAHPPGSGQIR